jgi:hypothetical protein
MPAERATTAPTTPGSGTCSTDGPRESRWTKRPRGPALVKARLLGHRTWLAVGDHQRHQPAAAESYTLSQCAIVQLGDSPRLYLARPDGELEVVDLETGAVLWHTKEVTLPLLARHDRVLALLPTALGKPSWDLAVLDARSGRIVARLPAWDSSAAAWANGRIGFGPVTTTRIVGVSRGGDDYVVWRRTIRTFRSGVPSLAPDPPPLHYSGAAKVDLVHATVLPVREAMPSLDGPAHPYEPRTSHFGPFTVEGVTVVAAMDSVGRRFRSVLHRTRDSTRLPDVVMCQRRWGGTWVGVSADTRDVVAACRVQVPGRYDLFDYLVYSAVTGEQVGVLRQSAPVSWVLWHTRLINLPVDSVVVMDLVAGKRLFALPVLSEATLTYSESVPAPPPRARP